VDDALADLVVRIESNTDALTALAVHALLERLVDRVTEQGEGLLRVNVAESITGDYGTTGDLEEHVGRHPVISAGDMIHGAVGIPPIDSGRRSFTSGDSDQADYPIFKDRGTGIFGEEPHQITPATRKVMRFEGMFGDTVFRHSVAGQEGAEFGCRTYEEMFSALPADVEIFERELKSLA
jgi:hypothetical protein